MCVCYRDISVFLLTRLNFMNKNSDAHKTPVIYRRFAYAAFLIPILAALSGCVAVNQSDWEGMNYDISGKKKPYGESDTI